jgi:hypothetical protein
MITARFENQPAHHGIAVHVPTSKLLLLGRVDYLATHAGTARLSSVFP